MARTVASSMPWWPAPPRALRDASRVLLTLFDDDGFSDFGCYGSPIRTPFRFTGPLSQLTGHGATIRRWTGSGFQRLHTARQAHGRTFEQGDEPHRILRGVFQDLLQQSPILSAICSRMLAWAWCSRPPPFTSAT